MKTIVMIDADKLVPHPDNPRKKLGDLTELADSIRAVGIMQNLTVVPFGDKYRILIGHRRCAAAKEAGLTELPCAVVDIPEKDQIEIMLLENMQRSDLTVLEESQGLQMMMNMGNSIRDICEKTGFSESKVRHRVKMGELDQKLLQKKFEESQNISIMDLQRLEQIKDSARKDRVLKMIGTPNFEMALKKAIDEENHLEWEEETFKQLPEGVCRADDTKGKTWLCSLRDWGGNESSWNKIESFSGKMYWKYGYSCIEIYVDTPAEALKKAEERRERNRLLDERKAAMKDILKRMKKLREEFVCQLSNRDCGYLAFHDGRMQKYMIRTMDFGCQDPQKLLNLLGVKVEEEPPKWNEEAWREILYRSINDTNFKRAIFLMLYLNVESNRGDTFDYYGKFDPKNHLEPTYEFMKLIGYQMSDEEKQMLDGTHELYVKGGKRMSNQKKRILALGVLLIVLFALAISDKDIGMFEYSCMFIGAELFLLLLFSFQTRIESQSRRILRQSGMIFHFMTGSGRYSSIKEVDAMPKVMSATGQIYIDFDEVMKILEGGDIIER